MRARNRLWSKLLLKILGVTPKVLYGSLTPRNAAGFVTQATIEGLFIGRSVWQAESCATHQS
ncbi:MAG: triose-phosphate isomerase [Verrucomicrobia bacterium]|nr:triose-phosphate isomerase [Verrucomicrobiota bacterium]